MIKGPRPRPTAIKLLRGSKLKLNPFEPKHPLLTSECPAELVDPGARAEWDRIAGLLIDACQVGTVDRAMLMGYCLKYGQWLALEAEAAKHPFLVKAPSGYPIPNPALSQANKTFHLVIKAAAELGITPSSRSRIIAPQGIHQGKWAAKLA